MPSEGVTDRYQWWENLTRRWWFFLLVIGGQIIPPYASEGFDWTEIGELYQHILTNALLYELPEVILPVFQLIPILLITGLLFRSKGFMRPFTIYVGLSYVLIAILQSISITEEFGFAVLSINLLMFLGVAAVWLWEAGIGKNQIPPAPVTLRRCWVIPLAVLAFWFPMNPVTLLPDFNPLYLLTSGSGLTFCMMTPVFLSVLIMLYPRVNLVTMRVTSLVGMIIGFYNLLVNFAMEPEILWWNGVLHIPLVVISVYALVLSFKAGACSYQTENSDN